MIYKEIFFNMGAKKKKSAIKKPVAPEVKEVVKEQVKEDFSRFTVPDPQIKEEENPNQEQFNINPQSIQSSQDSLFWGTRRGIVWLIFFGFIIIFSLIGGYFIFQQGITKDKDQSNVIAPSPTKPQASPTPTILEVILSEYKIRVLNGSGIAGEAAKVKNILENEGFNVASIGNADSSDYEETIIQLKDGTNKNYLEKLKEIMTKSYLLDNDQELTEDIDNDIIITLGSKKL